MQSSHLLRSLRATDPAVAPPDATPELYDWQPAACYKPAREVGGDFYDFLELEV